MIENQQPGAAPRVRIELLPTRYGAVGCPQPTALRRQTRLALRVASHLEHQLSPGTDGDREHQHGAAQPALEALSAVTLLASVVERCRGKLVRAALREGATWHQVGRALGVSKQAAHARYRAYHNDAAQAR